MSDDEGITRAQAEAWARELLAETRRLVNEDRAAEVAAATSEPEATRGTVAVTDREILVGVLKEATAHGRPWTDVELYRATDNAQVVAQYADAVAAKRVTLQARADSDAERTRANSLEGRALLGNLHARAAARKTQQAAEASALLAHENNLPPGALDWLTEDEKIAVASRPYESTKIDIAARTGAGWTKDEL